MMVAVIAVTIPFTIPKLLGFQIYEVLTGSMEPTYSIGSVVYIKETGAENIKIGDAITYTLEENSTYVMTHRVVELLEDKQAFITKGDANTSIDEVPVSFKRIIGKPVFCLPKFCFFSELIHTTKGKTIFLCIFASSLLLWLLAHIINNNENSDKNSDMNSGSKINRAIKNKKTNNRIRIIIRIMALIAITFAVIGLFIITLSYKKAEDEYKILQKRVTLPKKIVEKVESSSNNKEKVFIPNMKITENLQMLEAENIDTKGWISFDDLDINYPVMQGKDNIFYLTHTFSNTENKAGSIFMDAGNTPNFMDFHTIIYGHNMKNGSMFGLLKKFNESNFYDENKFFTIYTIDKVYRYQVFSVHTILENDEIYTIWYTPDKNNVNFGKFVNRMKNNSWYDTGVEILDSDRVVTLSTCTASDEKRFVVHGKLIAIYK